ncbi:SDR family NAD(P)-dependent oxidoreductase [Streptomyces sp. NPDC059785]|uniref:SDR family NAD(P)-dependent oxidoreductase n=1 Tax=unclassified Streptomyces TaxID=2593676 RepID=UPI00366882BD
MDRMTSLCDCSEQCGPLWAERLLARAQRLTDDGAQSLRGRKVLVTGAGGSIGSVLAHRVAALGADPVFLLDQDESALHAVQLSLCDHGFTRNDHVLLVDIRDSAQVHRAFRRTRPDIVFHAAALKHLPLLERHAGDAVRTNVLGTENLVNAALESAVGQFVFVSTDKAADPVSVLGATKRLAEDVVRAAAAEDLTRFASVRFGNVLGSRGSLLSVLAHQLRRGLPVTVTHPEVTRFFMTVTEAVELVVRVCAEAAHGEVYMLEMGAPVRVVHLVERYARLLNLPVPELRFTGLQPGEKLQEVLCASDERREPTDHPLIWNLGLKPVRRDLQDRLRELRGLAEAGRDDLVPRALAGLLGSYHPARGDESIASGELSGAVGR